MVFFLACSEREMENELFFDLFIRFFHIANDPFEQGPG